MVKSDFLNGFEKVTYPELDSELGPFKSVLESIYLTQ